MYNVHLPVRGGFKKIIMPRMIKKVAGIYEGCKGIDANV